MFLLPLEQLEQKINHNFSDKSLLQDALTHSSTGRKNNYERLEFLGDRVLGLVMADLLFTNFPGEKEGDLAKRQAALVQGSLLAMIARALDLGSYIAFSDAERAAGGSENDNILADVFESLVGALYIDSGLEKCQALIEKLWADHFFEMKAPPQHPKTTLQEWTQGLGLAMPTYEITGQSGPDHAPVFEITLKIEGYPDTVATGRSRQESEKEAARAFLKKLENGAA